MNVIDKALSALSIGEPTTYRNLAVFPLFAAEARTPGYPTLSMTVSKMENARASATIPWSR